MHGFEKDDEKLRHNINNTLKERTKVFITTTFKENVFQADLKVSCKEGRGRHFIENLRDDDFKEKVPNSRLGLLEV